MSKEHGITITVSEFGENPNQSRVAISLEPTGSGIECKGIKMHDLDRPLASAKDSKDSGLEENRHDVDVIRSSASVSSAHGVATSVNSDPSSTASISSAPCSHAAKDDICLPPDSAKSFPNMNFNQLLEIPHTGSFLNLSPRPLRKAISARCLSDLTRQTAGMKTMGSCASLAVSKTVIGDSASAISAPPAVNPEISQQMKTTYLKRNLSRLLSGIYAVFLLIFGGTLYLNEIRTSKRALSEIFSIVISALGIGWLLILHVDLYEYKKKVLKKLKERENALQESVERLSSSTQLDPIFNYNFTMQHLSPDENESPPYRFLIGRHSGSFYLKVGMAIFCVGYVIHEILQLAQHILNFSSPDEKLMHCSRVSSIILHAVLPSYAFYQLYITFKYSNVVINRHKALARIGLMHMIASCMCFWFNTILEEAVLDYHHKSSNSTHNSSISEFDVASFHFIIERRGNWVNPYHCIADAPSSIRSMDTIPYLYPFAIEYNILLAGVWFVIWQNIGQDHHPSNPHHLRHTISQDIDGGEEIAYQSNLVISVDCHSSNKGLFLGLILMLAIIVTVIVFFISISSKEFYMRAVDIHTSQEGLLTVICLVAVIISFIQIRKLDVNAHPITLLDDVLMFVPLPFYFIHGMMSIVAEYASENHTRLAVHVLVTIEVITQTTFIIDGLRRCSNSQALRYKKPGREIIIFLIIVNLALWVVNTFELKSVEKYHGQEHYYGNFVWMFIGHSTLPVMLFYRFHSSVCLADMWKSAYEKE